MAKKGPQKTAPIHPKPSTKLSDQVLRQADVPYPIWDGTWGGTLHAGASTHGNGLAWADVIRVFQALAESGILPSADDPESARPAGVTSTAGRAYVVELMASGADGNRLFRMLTGLDSSQRVPLAFLVNTVTRRRREAAGGKRLNQTLLGLERRYRQWMNNVGADCLLRSSTKELLATELEVIQRALRLCRAVDLDRPLPRSGITVKPSIDLSRQRFWSQAIPPFVSYLESVLGNRERAYKATARLLHLFFEYPDQPRLVMRRFLHTQQPLA